MVSSNYPTIIKEFSGKLYSLTKKPSGKFQPPPQKFLVSSILHQQNTGQFQPLTTKPYGEFLPQLSNPLVSSFIITNKTFWYGKVSQCNHGNC